MSVIEKAKTLVWFVQRPRYWQHALELFRRKFSVDLDTDVLRAEAMQWAASRAVPIEQALSMVGLRSGGVLPELSEDVIAQARARMAQSNVEMGGAGDLKLLYAAVVLGNARKAIETGVAYGWSSLALLSGLAGREDHRLISVDMPYPKVGNDPFVGIVVPDDLRNSWTLIREPDRCGIRKAIDSIGGTIDLVHYDSDKSHPGRMYGYPLLWNALRPGGIFISDDIEDNLAFREFMEREQATYAVVAWEGRYVGIARKPGHD